MMLKDKYAIVTCKIIDYNKARKAALENWSGDMNFRAKLNQIYLFSYVNLVNITALSS